MLISLPLHFSLFDAVVDSISNDLFDDVCGFTQLFPSFEDVQNNTLNIRTMTAKWADIREAYEEALESPVPMAHRLTNKSVFLTSLGKLHTGSALRVMDPSTIACIAEKATDDNGKFGTCEFLMLFHTFFKPGNVADNRQGARQRYSTMAAFTRLLSIPGERTFVGSWSELSDV